MEKTILKKLGALIRKRRIERDLSQERLAFASELSSDYLGKIELGKVNPSFIVMYKIAKAMKMDVSELTRGL